MKLKSSVLLTRFLLTGTVNRGCFLPARTWGFFRDATTLFSGRAWKQALRQYCIPLNKWQETVNAQCRKLRLKEVHIMCGIIKVYWTRYKTQDDKNATVGRNRDGFTVRQCTRTFQPLTHKEPHTKKQTRGTSATQRELQTSKQKTWYIKKYIPTSWSPQRGC